MEARLQRRIQRYGWDLAASEYEALWQAQLAGVQARLMHCAALAAGERVLDVACGTGLVTLRAAQAVGAQGEVVGIDLSERMVDAAQRRVAEQRLPHVRCIRMDAESLDLPDGGFDVVLCALGLMYMPDPARAVCEMRRVLRPGGRLVVAIWGERRLCGWAALFPLVDAEVASEVCPLFFQLGQRDRLAQLCTEAGFGDITQHRIAATLHHANAHEACQAAFVGGPVALAWSRFSAEVRERVRTAYLQAIAPWRHGDGYRIPAEFVVVAANARRA